MFYYHANHLGSVEVITDDQGGEVERRGYRPYGEPEAWSGPQLGNEELSTSFDGQRLDDATGLYYMGARHYDAQLGRFLGADVIVPNPADPRTLHRYAFAGGNPVRLSDPSGRYFWDDIIDAVVSVWDAAVEAANAVVDTTNAVVDFLQANGGAALAIATLVALVAISIAFPNPFTIGMALGAVTATLEHFADGGSADSLLGPLLLGAAIGGALGAAGGAAGSASKSIGKKLAQNGYKYLAAGLAKGTKAAKALAGVKQIYQIGVPAVALIGGALALHHRYVQPGFGGVRQSPVPTIRGSGATPFGLANLAFLVPGFQPDDPTLSRFNGLSTYPLAP